MNYTEKKALSRRRKKQLAALIGIAFALVCNALPTEYRVPCQTIVPICSGGF